MPSQHGIQFITIKCSTSVIYNPLSSLFTTDFSSEVLEGVVKPICGAVGAPPTYSYMQFRNKLASHWAFQASRSPKGPVRMSTYIVATQLIPMSQGKRSYFGWYGAVRYRAVAARTLPIFPDSAVKFDVASLCCGVECIHCEHIFIISKSSCSCSFFYYTSLNVMCLFTIIKLDTCCRMRYCWPSHGDTFGRDLHSTAEVFSQR